MLYYILYQTIEEGEVKLPTNWKMNKDEHANIYYYNTITRFSTQIYQLYIQCVNLYINL